MDRKLRLSLLFQAGGNVKSFLGGVRAETDRATKGLGQARERVQALQRAAKDVSGFRAMETRLAGTRNELAQARAEALRLGTAMDTAENPTKQLTRAFEAQTNKVRALETQQAGQVRGLSDLKAKLDGAGISTDRLGAHELKLTRDLKGANAELATQSRRLNDVAERQRRMSAARQGYDRSQQLAGSAMGAGASAIGAGVTAAAPLIVSAKAGMSFEDGMADIRKVVNFDTPQQFRQMETDILNLSTRIPIASEGITSIIASAGQAGIARRELMLFAEDAGKMGIAFDTTAEDAGQKMATWRTAFRMTQPEVRSLADQINYLGNTGPANALAISNIVTRIGPLGEVAGLAAGEIAALGSTIAGMGVEEEIAATGIKNTMLALTKGTAATKAQKSAYSALGLEAEGVSRRMQMDAGGTIVDVMERISKLKPEQQSAIMTQLFGSESVAAIAPMLTNLKLLRGNLAKVADESLFAGSMQKEFEGRASTASNSAKLGLQGLKAVATEVGLAFLPTIKDGALALRDMSQGIRGFAEAHPGTIKVMGTLLAIVAGGLLVFGGLALAAAAILGPFALLNFVLAGTGALFAPVVAGLLGTGAAAGGAAIGVNALLWPVLAVIAAVAVLAGVAYLIYKNWGPISSFFAKVGARIGQAFAPVANFFKAAWRLAQDAVGLAIDWITLKLLQWTPLGALVRNWGGITGYLGGIWNSAKAGVSGAITAISSAISGFKPLNDFKAAFSEVWTWLGGLPGRMLQAGADAMSGLSRGIRGQRAAVQAETRAVASGMVSTTRQVHDTHSPSRVFAKLGDFAMQGLALGVRRSTGSPMGAMRTAASALTAAGALGLSASIATPAMSFESGQLRGASAGARGSRGGAAPTVTIVVNAAPGMDEDRLAQLVAEHVRRGGGGGGGSFSDDDYGEGD